MKRVTFLGRRIEGRLVALTLAGMLIGGVAAAAPSAAVPAVPAAQPQSGSATWAGSPSGELSDLEPTVSALTAQYPEVFAGSEYARDYSTLTVYATELGSSAVAELKAATRGEPGADAIRLVRVEHSMADLEAASASIDLAGVAGGVSVGPDVSRNAVTLGRDDTVGGAGVGAAAVGAAPAIGSTLTVGEVRERIATTRNQKASPDPLADVPVVVVADRSGTQKAEDRYNDAGPYYTMGAAIFSSGSRCSLGVPLVVNGTFMALTAGHCTGSTFTNQAGSTVGTQYTTSYSANADIYGDWKLIRGQHYRLSVWSGGRYGSETLPMSGADWGTRPIGAQMCTSGSTTGQVCRFFVQSVNQTVTVGGVVTGKQTRMYHDGNLDGAGDCSGFAGGDSGGPAYYSNGSGGVVANGIVTSYNTSSCIYGYTQLSGVRAWNSSVTFG